MLSGGDRYGRFLLSLAILATATAPFFLAPTSAQVFSPSPGQVMTSEQAEAMMRAQAGAVQVRGGPAQPQTGQPPAGEEKKEEEPKEEKKEEEDSSTVKRPEKPPRVPDPREFDVALDERGRVPPFNFIGQPWPDVLQWLAKVSNASLDWQELPNDYLNLTTERPQTLDEVRDLLNRLLHARGYTMLEAGDVLSVFKIEKLDPSLVPRVTEDELYDRRPYDFVKIAFQLPDALAPDKAVEDVKQALSPNAKVLPLVATKRILVLDAVVNLRLVSALLNEERLVADGRIVPREFPLKYARADQVIDAIYVVLGMDPKSRPTQMELQLQQQKLQIMQQMQQQGTDISKMLKQDGPPVHLAYNRQRNSVLANAPPEYMRIIEETVELLDVPFGGGDGAGDVMSGVGTAGNRQLKKYTLTTLDPQSFMMTLEEIGGLDPRTDVRADTKTKGLFVQAGEADHKKVAWLIEQFDGEGRRFHAIRLRRLPADLAAVSIKELMIGEEKKEDDSRRSPYIYYYGSGRQEEKTESPHEGFRVVADVEGNRLLLRANDAELAEVHRLLTELGEIPAERSDPRPVRFIQPGDNGSTAQLLEQLRSAWPAMGAGELIINVPEPDGAAPADEPTSSETEEETPADDHSAAAPRPPQFAARFVQIDMPESESAPHANEHPPVTVTVTEDGRLMISSADTAALDRLEELMEELTPPTARFKVYRLQNISALNMYWNLTDFFEEELTGDPDYMMDWYGRYQRVGDKSTATGLARRRKLMITYDTPSNTVMVANASPSQLHEVEALIAEYDQPAPADSIKSRRTAAIKIRYSRASVIATALKDVYRDLLSTRDREFDSGDQRQRNSAQERTTIINYGGSQSEGGSKRPTPVKVGFEGALSVGVDEIANMLVVSVQEELFDDVVRMIEHLDQEAAPNTTVHVHRVNGPISAASLRKALNDSMGKPWPGGRPEKEEAATPGPDQQQGDDRGNRGRRGRAGGNDGG